MNTVLGTRFTIGCLLFTTATTMLSLLAAPAMAGVAAAPALDPVGHLELQFDNSTQQFLLVDDGTVVAGPQLFFDGRAISNGQRGALILDPEFDQTAATPDMLVTFANSPSQVTIDEGKLAIGAGKRTGTDRGFITSSDTLRIDFPLLAVADPRIQVEVKQDVAAKVVFLLNGTPVGEPHYLLSGRSVSNPPSEVPVGDPDRICEVRPNQTDGGSDSGNNDDGFCLLPTAPLHNAEIWTVINGGKLAIKGGGEYPDPASNRTSWLAYALDGFLDCGDEFASDGSEVTGRRAITNVGGGCTSLIGYDIEFDAATNTVSFEVVDPDNQNLGTIFDVEFEPQPLGDENDPTLLSYTDEINCEDPLVSDPSDPNQATRSCIALDTCVGQPIRACSDSGNSCSKDSECDIAGGESCDTLQLIPPTGGFPDLVLATLAPQTEYGCVLEETVIYLGSPGSCSLDSSISCATDTDCPGVDSGEVCNLENPEVQVLQEIFIFDDVRFGRR